MKIEDPRSVTSSPLLRQTPPANAGPAKPDVQRPQNGASPAGQPAARAYEPVSGRLLEVLTTEPGV